MQSEKEKIAASAKGNKTKKKTSLACVSISLLPCLKKGACYLARLWLESTRCSASRGLGSVVLSAAAWRCDSEAG